MELTLEPIFLQRPFFPSLITGWSPPHDPQTPRLRLPLTNTASPSKGTAHTLASRAVDAAPHAGTAAASPCTAGLVRVVWVQTANPSEQVEDVS